MNQHTSKEILLKIPNRNVSSSNIEHNFKKQSGYKFESRKKCFFLNSIFEPLYFLKLHPIFDRLSLLVGIF